MNIDNGYKELEKLINHRFNNSNLIITALSHSSYRNEKQTHEDYERLEFLGDAVLELTVSEFLYKENPNMKEGDMTKMRASLVCEQTLAFCAMDIELSRFILLGKGEEKTGGRSRDSIISDVFEALIGALFLDQGFDAAKDFITRYVLNDYRNKIEFSDSKTTLQEYVQDKKYDIEYVLVKEAGPDHDKQYTVDVLINNKVCGSGTGSSKKRAEQRAAYEALKTFK